MDFLIWNFLFSDAVRFTLNGNNCQDNKQHCSKKSQRSSQNSFTWSYSQSPLCSECMQNPNAAHRTPLHGLTVRVHCAVSACKITGPVFFKEIVYGLYTTASQISRFESCNYYKWRTLKGGVYVNSPCNVQGCGKKFLIFHVSRNIFRRFQACLEAGGWHFYK